MNRGFTKLEIILVGIILLFTISFLGTKNLGLFVDKENLLKQRFNKFVSLLDDKNYSEAYNFYGSSIKNKDSLEDYIKGTKKFSNIGKQKVSINNIVIKDNIGYIDRSNTICEDSNCNTKKELRGYKRWVFENGNWYYFPPDPRCIREEMYDMPPEFKRALSLINQRFTDWYKKSNMENSFDLSYLNCVDIQYGDTENAEGLFTFDEKSSSIEKLYIIVDKSYVNSDDLLTALLLAHETTHANIYLMKIIEGAEISCVDNEVNAFNNQLLLGNLFNSEERESLNRRLQKGYQGLNNQLKINWDMLILRDQAEQICRTNQFDNCTMKEVIPLIERMVRSNPYYQKQCGLN